MRNLHRFHRWRQLLNTPGLIDRIYLHSSHPVFHQRPRLSYTASLSVETWSQHSLAIYQKALSQSQRGLLLLSKFVFVKISVFSKPHANVF